MIRLTDAAVRSAAAAIQTEAEKHRPRRESHDGFYERVARVALDAALLDLIEDRPGQQPIPSRIIRLGRPLVMDQIENTW